MRQHMHAFGVSPALKNSLPACFISFGPATGPPVSSPCSMASIRRICASECVRSTCRFWLMRQHTAVPPNIDMLCIIMSIGMFGNWHRSAMQS